jgi:hypothetical protein
MSFELKSTRVDRDDFGADHYADFIRDTHRSRLTLDQLDIINRQLRKKEKFLTHIHGLRMKEHMRIKNDFIRKIEQDECLANLPTVKENLKAQRRIHLDIPSSTEATTQQVQKPHQLEQRTKTTIKLDSPRTERLKANLDKFNHTNTLLD